jgi:hypothetical protein
MEVQDIGSSVYFQLQENWANLWTIFVAVHTDKYKHTATLVKDIFLSQL